MQFIRVEAEHEQQLEAQQMQAEISMDQLLEQALAQPAAATMVEVPKPVVPCMRRLLQQCMAWFNASVEEHRRHPGKRVEEEVWRRSALLRLAPALLLRRLPGKREKADSREDDEAEEDLGHIEKGAQRRAVEADCCMSTSKNETSSKTPRPSVETTRS